jgi:hypothetical protein
VPAHSRRRVERPCVDGRPGFWRAIPARGPSSSGGRRDSCGGASGTRSADSFPISPRHRAPFSSKPPRPSPGRDSSPREAPSRATPGASTGVWSCSEGGVREPSFKGQAPGRTLHWRRTPPRRERAHSNLPRSTSSLPGSPGRCLGRSRGWHPVHAGSWRRGSPRGPRSSRSRSGRDAAYPGSPGSSGVPPSSSCEKFAASSRSSRTRGARARSFAPPPSYLRAFSGPTRQGLRTTSPRSAPRPGRRRALPSTDEPARRSSDRCGHGAATHHSFASRLLGSMLGLQACGREAGGDNLPAPPHVLFHAERVRAASSPGSPPDASG